MKAVDRLLDCYDYSVAVFVVKDELWEQFERELPESVKNIYQDNGYYKIYYKGIPKIGHKLGIPAITFRGIPVIKLSSYKKYKHWKRWEKEKILFVP